MKNIFDFYENTSTPANTTGMGNPMPASEDCNGSEPLAGKKKAKCKKEKEKISEASILDIEGTLSDNGELLEFAKWMTDSYYEFFKITGTSTKVNRDELFSGILKVVQSSSKGVFEFDCYKAFEILPNDYWTSRIFITEKGFPKTIKEIKFINFKYDGIKICSLTNDLSKIKFRVFKDSGNTLGEINFVFWGKMSKKNVKLGKIECDKFKFEGKDVESLALTNGSIYLSVDVSNCETLKSIIGRFESADEVKLNTQLIVGILNDMGLVPYGAKIHVYG